MRGRNAVWRRLVVLALGAALVFGSAPAGAHPERDANNCWDDEVPDATLFAYELEPIGVSALVGSAQVGTQLGSDNTTEPGSGPWVDVCTEVQMLEACVLGLCTGGQLVDSFFSVRMYDSPYGCFGTGVPHSYVGLHTFAGNLHQDVPCDLPTP